MSYANVGSRENRGERGTPMKEAERRRRERGGRWGKGYARVGTGFWVDAGGGGRSKEAKELWMQSGTSHTPQGETRKGRNIPPF